MFDRELRELYKKEIKDKNIRPGIVTKNGELYDKEQAKSPKDLVDTNIHKRMTWQEFRALPADVKESYLKWLVDTFSVSNGEIAGMLGCGYSTLGLLLHESKIRGATKSGKRKKTAEQWKAWDEFLNPPAPMQSDPQEPQEEEKPQPTAPKTAATETNCGTTTSLLLTKCIKITPQSTAELAKLLELSLDTNEDYVLTIRASKRRENGEIYDV